MKFFAILLLLTAVMCVSADAKSATPKGFLLKSEKFDDATVNYTVYVPQSYDGKTDMPLIIFLNGLGECGTDGLRQLVTGLPSAIMFNAAKWDRFITLIPQKQQHVTEWGDAEDAHVMGLIKRVCKDYKIDTHRVYLTGLSQGGRGTWRIAANHPDMFAAIAPCCGWGDEEIAKKVKDIPIWMFHGTKDEAVPYHASEQMNEWLTALGADVKFTTYEGYHHNCWDHAYRDEDIPGFFLSHRK